MTGEQTNFNDFSRDIDLKQSLLWLMYHGKRWTITDLLGHPLWKTCQTICLIDQECIFNQKDIEFDHRIHLWDSTVSSHPRLHTYLFWFDWVRIIDESNNLSAKLLPWQDKKPTYIFDALFGVMRSNRAFVADKIDHHRDHDKFIKGSRQPTMDQLGKQLSSDYIPGGSFESGFNLVPKKQNLEDLVNVTCMTPYKIYNDSWYSIVTETHPQRIFYTEKTAKVLLAKRPFVFFGSQHSLHHLRNLGYKTFGEVIDESYDNEHDHHTRWNQAWKQVEHLLTLDPITVYQKLSDVLDHNHKLFVSSNHWKKLCDEIQKTIDNT